MKLAVIPARGGSKRIPRKNIRPFHGKPMIAHSIAAAKASGQFDRIVVSTDDAEVADVAKQYGADVPFLRPDDLSGDTAGTVEVIQHAVRYFADKGEVFEHVCCLYATAPFVTADDIAKALVLLESRADIDYVFPVTTFAYPIQRALRMDETQQVLMLQPQHQSTRSQDLEEAYHDVGQFYWGTADAYLNGRAIIGANSKAIVIPRQRAQDIDTEEDWRFAEMLFQIQQQ